VTRRVDYDTIASAYDDRYRRTQYGGVERLVVAHAGRAGVRALEIGCGTGHWLGILRARGAHAAGLDVSREMLKRAADQVPNAPLVRGRAEELPWRDASFDRVLCVNAFHHFARKEDAVAGARRILRHGGGLLIIGLDPHSGRDVWWIYDYFESTYATDAARYPPANEIRAMMAAAGFRRCATVVAQHFSDERAATAMLKEGHIEKSVTSQLTSLHDEEFATGVERIRTEIAEAESHGGELRLTTDLRLWATTGWIE
jgi:ubiquinone/menaquinone biosynthesis C-methylase UbiE